MRLAARSPRRAAGKRRDVFATFGMARRDDQQRVGKVRAQRARAHRARSRPRLHASTPRATRAARRSAPPARARAVASTRGAGAASFRLPSARTCAAAQFARAPPPCAHRRRRRSANALNSRAPAALPLRPPAQRARAHARIHERQRHAARLRFKDEVRPDFAFDETRRGRAASDRRKRRTHIGAIERRVDMRRARRRAARDEFGRRARAGAEQKRERRIARGQRFDQRQRHAAFANARRVQPDQRAGRARLRVAAEAFADARRDLPCLRARASLSHSASDRRQRSSSRAR